MAQHTPETLVKYCDPGSAYKILQSHSLRWSAPNVFLDPFELDHQTGLNFDPHVLLQAAIQSAAGMIFSKDEPRGNTPMINAIRRWRDEERFQSPDEAETVLRDLLSQMVDARQKDLDAVMADWRKFSRMIRISCFSEKPDNLSAWQRYADHHRGVAIRFQSGEFTALPKPRSVSYRNVRPEITTLKEQLDVLLNNVQFRAQDYFLEKFSTRPPECKDEQEWRCFKQATQEMGSEPTSWYEDHSFERADVAAIYFGVHTPTKLKRAIYELAKEHYGQSKIFQAKAVIGKYEIEFERIGKK